MESRPRPAYIVEFPWIWYIIDGLILLMLTGLLVVAIIIVVCLCDYLRDIKKLVKDIHAALTMLAELKPCIENICQPPPII